MCRFAATQKSYGVCCVVPVPGSVFYTREALGQAKLHQHSFKGVSCVNDPELHADAVSSGMC